MITAIDRAQFRSALGAFTTGVTIVTHAARTAMTTA